MPTEALAALLVCFAILDSAVIIPYNLARRKKRLEERRRQQNDSKEHMDSPKA